MAVKEQIDIFKQGPEVWNKWRQEYPHIAPDLSDADFESDLHTYESMFDMPAFVGFDLRKTNLNRITARNSTFTNCEFAGSNFHFSDLCFSYFHNCNFERSSLAVTKIGSAEFINCNFFKADLSYCSAEETNFTGSNLDDAKLSNMSLVKTCFNDTTINGARVYGVSAWDLSLENCQQSSIYIEESGTSITVPTIELAQFISLLVNNSKIRDVIDTITSKVVLILGRFTPERKAVLDTMKVQLESKGYLPVLFDFDGPSNRDVTETVITLALLSKFVVADISSPKSIPQELTSIVPHFPSVPVQPVIEKSQLEYGMFEHFKRYPWVLEQLAYSDDKIGALVELVVQKCEEHIKN
ncbi:pentapeptide repeat-containing protein [Vibrio pectenicida]|uniref:Pentapeptide repeat-containing protein n=1 Tax=Vibrio pectenicida TaxID=62763 RepID=A0A3R9EFF7_9VIBR|nr:pentapeptide repeat-containing protein [Vibrio pectenicida]RSD30463.1 pentapeptide repeat-containing protein [Vibrio pectenicida]